jgi:GT2 family glycosyltransferase
MQIQLSVVVPSLRRSEELERCLDDLATQVDAPSLEAIVVLQAYPPGAAQALRQRYSGRLDLQIAEFKDGLGTAGARNRGLELARGDIVAFLDDDVRLPPRWAASLVAAYSDASVGGVGGFVDHPGHYGPLRNTMYRILGLTSNRFRIDWGGFNVGPAFNPRGVEPAAWLGGGNMSFRRSALVGIGGFDEALGTFWHEDVDVTHRVATAGWRVLCSEHVTVEHYPSTINRPPLYAQTRERERSRVLFVWKAIGDKPLWRVRYGLRLLLHAAAMSVVGMAKRDLRIPVNVIRGGWEGYRSLPASRAASGAKATHVS